MLVVSKLRRRIPNTWIAWRLPTRALPASSGCPHHSRGRAARSRTGSQRTSANTGFVGNPEKNVHRKWVGTCWNHAEGKLDWGKGKADGKKDQVISRFHSWRVIPELKHGRRKFRSETSDNMDRWKSRGGKSQRGEVKKWEEQRRERVRRKKMQVREKVGKSRFTVFFQWFVALGGRKVGSLKRGVRSHLARCDERWKIARRCGAKQVSKSTCTKHILSATCQGPWRLHFRP